jgi:L-serine deaminase
MRLSIAKRPVQLFRGFGGLPAARVHSRSLCAIARNRGPREHTIVGRSSGALTRHGPHGARSLSNSRDEKDEEAEGGSYSEADHEHAVISTFDLFSIGIGPSSSHTVGPMRAGNIFVADLIEAGLLEKVHRIRVSVYGSLALTGEGHMTPSALLLGLESADVETVDAGYVPERFAQIKEEKEIVLGNGLPDGKGKRIAFDYDRDFIWEWGKKLPMHSNGMRFMVFDEEGYMLATNDLFSVGGGFVVNGAMSINPTAPPSGSDQAALVEANEAGHPADLAENMYYKEIRRADAAGDRKTGTEIKSIESAALEDSDSSAVSVQNQQDGTPSLFEGDEDARGSGQQPRYPFRDATSLLALCEKHNLTIAQLVYENEKSHGYTDKEIVDKVFRIWDTMDNSILEGVQAPLDSVLPGSLKLHRRAPALYNRLTRGLYPASHTQNGVRPSNANRSNSTKTSASESVAAPSKELARAEPKTRSPAKVHGSLFHPVLPSPMRRTMFPAMDHLSVYAIGTYSLPPPSRMTTDDV